MADGLDKAEVRGALEDYLWERREFSGDAYRDHLIALVGSAETLDALYAATS
jgi:hypothetical protein